MPKTPSKPSTKTRGRQPAEKDEKRARSKRVPAGKRRRELLDAALELFAKRGTGITIQSLADRVQVTQPLVHRYFPTKADLIANISRELREAHWDDSWHDVLTDRSRPLEERILDFYALYLPHIFRRKWYRGFWYVALENPRFAQSYLARVEGQLLSTIIDEARFTFGFPSTDAVVPAEREMELVWGMHSTAIFHGIRRYVYDIPAWPEMGIIVQDQMRAYLHIVPEVMAELFARKPPARRGSRAKVRSEEGR